MLDVNFDPFPLLVTERLILRPVNTNDAKEIYFLRSDDEVMKYVGRPKCPSIEEAIKWAEMVEEARIKNEGVTWAIALKNDPRLTGILSFWKIDKANYRAEVGYVLHPDHQKKGIM